MDSRADKRTIHNAVVKDIVGSIVMPVIDNGDRFEAALVILESVIAGVVMFGERAGMIDPRGREAYFALLAGRASARLAEIEVLAAATPAGSA